MQTRCASACAGNLCTLKCAGRCGTFNSQCGPWTCSTLSNACTKPTDTDTDTDTDNDEDGAGTDEGTGATGGN